MPPLSFRRLCFSARLLRWCAIMVVALVIASYAAGDAASDSKPEVPDADPALPAAADLRPSFDKWGLARRTQGTRATCSVFTMAGAFEFAAATKLQHGTRFSIEFLNWAANQAGHENKDGGFFSDLWSGYAKYGICPEDKLPYADRFDPEFAPTAEVLLAAREQLSLGLRQHWIKKWDVKTGLTEAEFIEIKRTLNQGWPVCAGLRWPKNAVWSEGVLGMCPPDRVFDGHSVLLVGYRDDSSQSGGGVLIFRNSNNAGRDGYMPYVYARAYMNDAVWIDFEATRPPAASVTPRNE